MTMSPVYRWSEGNIRLSGLLEEFYNLGKKIFAVDAWPLKLQLNKKNTDGWSLSPSDISNSSGVNGTLGQERD